MCGRRGWCVALIEPMLVPTGTVLTIPVLTVAGLLAAPGGTVLEFAAPASVVTVAAPLQS